MNTTNLIITIFGSGAFGSAVTYLLSLKRNNAITRGSELENIEKALEVWRQTNEELKTQVRELKEEVGHLNDLVSQLHTENKQLKSQLEAIR